MVGFCDFCKEIKTGNAIYTVYRIGFFTNLNFYSVGILHVYDDLDKFLAKRHFHISPTQVALLRPDILLEFLQEKFNKEGERVKSCMLYGSEMCEKCYENYKKEVPER
jgi:hypothetical protein